jgi:hypothetical protein
LLDQWLFATNEELVAECEAYGLPSSASNIADNLSSLYRYLNQLEQEVTLSKPEPEYKGTRRGKGDSRAPPTSSEDAKKEINESIMDIIDDNKKAFVKIPSRLFDFNYEFLEKSLESRNEIYHTQSFSMRQTEQFNEHKSKFHQQMFQELE